MYTKTLGDYQQELYLSPLCLTLDWYYDDDAW